MNPPFTFSQVGIVLVLGLIAAGFSMRRKRLNKQKSEDLIEKLASIESIESRKINAVIQLKDMLEAAFADASDMAQGLPALRYAQKKAEMIYFEWVNEHHDMFQHLLGADFGIVRIVGIKNGEYQYELPTDLKRYLKGKRK